MSTNQSSSGNPYAFITDPNKPVKPSFFGGGSKPQRILVVVGIVSLILIVIILFSSLLGGTNSGMKADYQSLVTQQAEIIRISTLATEKTKGAEAKNLAITTSLSLQSSQAKLNGIAKAGGASVDTKTLALSKNTKTDEALDSAEQSNTYDETYITTISSQLVAYQKTLKRLYDQASKPSTKLVLEEAYKNATVLTQNGKP